MGQYDTDPADPSMDTNLPAAFQGPASSRQGAHLPDSEAFLRALGAHDPAWKWSLIGHDSNGAVHVGSAAPRSASEETACSTVGVADRRSASRST